MCASLLLQAMNRGSKRQNLANHARKFIQVSSNVEFLVLMASKGASSTKWKGSEKSDRRLSSQSMSINNWAKHISACFFEILQVIGKSSSKQTFNQSIDSYHACRGSCHQCPASAACRKNNDCCYNILKEVVESRTQLKNTIANNINVYSDILWYL